MAILFIFDEAIVTPAAFGQGYFDDNDKNAHYHIAYSGQGELKSQEGITLISFKREIFPC